MIGEGEGVIMGKGFRSGKDLLPYLYLFIWVPNQPAAHRDGLRMLLAPDGPPDRGSPYTVLGGGGHGSYNFCFKNRGAFLKKNEKLKQPKQKLNQFFKSSILWVTYLGVSPTEHNRTRMVGK